MTALMHSAATRPAFGATGTVRGMTVEGTAQVDSVARIGHAEAMALTERENGVLARQLRQLTDDDWTRPTDCTRWDVRSLVVHVVASAQAQASPLEFFRQVRAGRPLTAQIGGTHWVDGVNEAQLRARHEWTTTSLPQRWETESARALAARRGMPAPVRRLPLLPLGDALGVRMGWKPLAYLFDIGFTRDVWMHRVDISRATGRPLELAAEHDGRIVADIVAEWAGTHGEAFELELTGPAGGTFARGRPEPEAVVTIDAVECCRVLSGRRDAGGVLDHRLPL